MTILVKITDKLKEVYPNAVFGSLLIKNIPNKKNHPQLESAKHDLENFLRSEYKQLGEDKILEKYQSHFGKWNKTYPIEFQIQSIQKGTNLPQVSILVDSMFHAELKNRILTSGHDLDLFNGNELIFDLSDGSENYTKINGKDQILKKNDILLKDKEGILANVLYGPAKRSSINMKTQNVLYFAWCPQETDKSVVITHLNDILSNLENVFPSITPELNIYNI
ncbi:MAG: phenylalanine--tRNA ligase beta subunit-related protein [Candidatus Hodarchaeales archaeon]|jgi:DNA/RNA-binding domain of Phe-tRNA-synthetase-like protein